MCDYCTEAEALYDMYDGDEVWGNDYYELSISDKWEYVYKRGHSFHPSDVGKWVVVTTPRRKRNTIDRMFLVDRNRTKKWWWSPASHYAMVFDKQSAAEYQAKRYKFNKPRVMQITKKMTHYYYIDY